MRRGPTATTPQVKALTQKQARTQTQPYPPSGGGDGGASAVATITSIGCPASSCFSRESLATFEAMPSDIESQYSPLPFWRLRPKTEEVPFAPS